MKIKSFILKIRTKKEFEIIKITDKILSFFKECKCVNGFINVYSRHTTLAVKINENEKLLLKDFSNFLRGLTPDSDYYHNKIDLRENCLPNEPKNASGHLKNMVLECSQMIPVVGGVVMLGKFQDIFLIETSGPRSREIVAQVVCCD